MLFEDLKFYIEKFKFEQESKNEYNIVTEIRVILNIIDFKEIYNNILNNDMSEILSLHTENGIIKYTLENYILCSYYFEDKNCEKSSNKIAHIILNINNSDVNFSYTTSKKEIIYSANERIIQNIID